MGREMGGRFKRKGIYVYLWLIHIEVWQKTIKFYKETILQKISLKMVFKGKKKKHRSKEKQDMFQIQNIGGERAISLER